MCGTQENKAKSRAQMAKSCSNSRDPRNQDDGSCACIPTRIVEEDLETGTNPLGRDRASCIEVEEDMVFKGFDGW